MNLLKIHRCIISQESKKETPIWIKRREDLLLSEKELQVNHMIHYSLNGTRASQNLDDALLLFRNTKNNDELIETMLKRK